MMTVETKIDTGRLKELERVIENGKQKFVEMGIALAEIRDTRLYRKNYSTFEDYCLEKWGWSKSHSNRLIEAAKVATEMTPRGVSVQPIESEKHARELSRIKNTVLRSQVWQEVTKTAAESEKPITTSLIKEAVQKHIPREVKQLSREEDGTIIIQKINQIRHELTPSQKIFDVYLQNCVRDIRHASTLSDEQKIEIVLFAVEESHAHTIQELVEDNRLRESEVKSILSSLVKKDLLESRARWTVGGSAQQMLYFSKRKPCSCV